MNDGSCIRLRPEHRNHVWSYDLLAERTSDGRPLRMLNVVDEFLQECLKIHVDRRARAADVLNRRDVKGYSSLFSHSMVVVAFIDRSPAHLTIVDRLL